MLRHGDAGCHAAMLFFRLLTCRLERLTKNNMNMEKLEKKIAHTRASDTLPRRFTYASFAAAAAPPVLFAIDARRCHYTSRQRVEMMARRCHLSAANICFAMRRDAKMPTATP